jgi:pyrroline-5-carboxylate reductase
MRKKIGIIGCGNMGSAIAGRLNARYAVYVFDQDPAKIRNLAGFNVCQNARDLIATVDTIILAVKPQDFDGALNEIKPLAKNKLVISIAAGITTGYIERFLESARVIRTMPNMPAKIGKGMTVLCKGASATDEDLGFARQLFEYLGKTLIIDEEMLAAATAISGSGPGYFFDLVHSKDLGEIKGFAKKIFVPTFIKAAQSVGFTPEQAKLLAETTAAGSIDLLEETQAAPSELRNQVTSKGGTTEAGLEVLHSGGSLEDAVKAARERAIQLSRR